MSRVRVDPRALEQLELWVEDELDRELERQAIRAELEAEFARTLAHFERQFVEVESIYSPLLCNDETVRAMRKSVAPPDPPAHSRR